MNFIQGVNKLDITEEAVVGKWGHIPFSYIPFSYGANSTTHI
jgi:hypothetical protein